ncbi:DUF2523 family protein [Phytopseudomonas seleniipraecipitans]|uniref:DUF2523 domain-containing protein n=1 Tax=Phytopseudomonas seleniipraecipitans TaxID=640205 RepID=A0A1G7NMR5_9GAMM|nr:DUF2523 family protein [Pseudomonas seleniipraecipitans]SDF75231.1 Protein of unknown function [Pseudomonas seleniipraecipitans]
MFEWLGGFLDQIIQFFQWVWDFLSVGIYAFVKDAMVLLTKAAMYSWIQIQLIALEVAYEAAQGVMADIGVAEAVRQRYGDLPGDVASTLSFFGIPQALNIIFSALSTRFALKFVPFIGR